MPTLQEFEYFRSARDDKKGGEIVPDEEFGPRPR